jgi:hypothetical protein
VHDAALPDYREAIPIRSILIFHNRRILLLIFAGSEQETSGDEMLMRWERRERERRMKAGTGT